MSICCCCCCCWRELETNLSWTSSNRTYLYSFSKQNDFYFSLGFFFILLSALRFFFSLAMHIKQTVLFFSFCASLLLWFDSVRLGLVWLVLRDRRSPFLFICAACIRMLLQRQHLLSTSFFFFSLSFSPSPCVTLQQQQQKK